MNNKGYVHQYLVFTFTLSLLALIPSLHCRRISSLTSSSPGVNIEYNHGTLLTNPTLNVYIVWYGTFTPQDKAPIADFITSFGSSSNRGPTVASWWKTMQEFKDAQGKPVSPNVKLVQQIEDKSGSMKQRPITREEMKGFLKQKIESKALPLEPEALYFIITDKSVAVDHFCMDSCGFHDQVEVTQPQKMNVPYVHIGDPSKQCPGLCGWPYALPQYHPKEAKPLVAPNGLAADSIVMNMATLLADATTNPFKNGYYQGDARAPLEAATACMGIFGKGAYPGNPGELLVDPKTNASYNVNGVNGRKFLVTAIWDLQTKMCKTVS